MQIIPVIDIRDGNVVHATGGDRRFYPPLISTLTTATAVEQVLQDILAWAPFQQIYIADLDAIDNGVQNHALYETLAELAGEREIWLDAGIKTAADLGKGTGKIRWVLGSETLEDIQLLTASEIAMVLSLDFKHQQLLGLPELLAQPSLWPEHVMVMDLDHVGKANGPGIRRLMQWMQRYPEKAWYAAGGVRQILDIEELERIGVAGTLLATALHQGKITRGELMQYLNEE